MKNKNEIPKKLVPREIFEYLDQDGNLKSEPYKGGIAFETILDAQAYAVIDNHPEWSVYALNGDWKTDVYFDTEDKIFRINKDLQLIEEVNL